VPFIVVAVALVVVLAFIALLPLSLVMRYRAGTARRVARRWMMTVNVVGLTASAGFFLLTAAVTNIWVPSAFVYALAGLAAGILLGFVGLWLTKWEPTPQSLYFTPNRWLVLTITAVVSARVIYGFWRAWQAWGTTSDGTTWLAAAGAAGSLAAGAVVLGYYWAYWAGVRRRVT
jgi:hypothetical protein